VGRLFETIRQLVADGRYVIGQHAAERLDERGVLEWQVVDGIEEGLLLAERPDALPNPAVEVYQSLADGTDVKTTLNPSVQDAAEAALAEATRSVSDQTRHLVEPTVAYFFRNAWRRALDEDFVLHVGRPPPPWAWLPARS